MLRFFLILMVGALMTQMRLDAQHMNEKDSPCAKFFVTAGLVSCLAKAKDVADVRLCRAYKNLRERLDPADLQRLVVTQRLWIQYRNANCTAERELYAGGTAASPAYLACLEAMARARTQELAVTYALALK